MCEIKESPKSVPSHFLQGDSSHKKQYSKPLRRQQNKNRMEDALLKLRLLRNRSIVTLHRYDGEGKVRSLTRLLKTKGIFLSYTPYLNPQKNKVASLAVFSLPKSKGYCKRIFEVY